MKKRILGKTNLETSEIGLGCWALGGQCTINGIPTTYGNVDETSAIKIIKKAYQLGINTFDTADVYSLGNSERRLGRALNENRKKVFIFTKAGGIPSINGEKRYELDLSFNHLLAALDRSLRRLNTNYVDLFQAHTVPTNEMEFKTLENVFKEVKNSGKANFCGVSIGSKYRVGMELIKRGLVDTLQIYFSLLDFEPVNELLPLARKENVGVIVAEPLSQGFLSGKYSSGHIFPSTDIRSTFSKDEIEKRIEQSNRFKILESEGKNLSQIALSYILSRNEVSVCIPGSKNLEQLESNVNASIMNISSDELAKIKEIQKSF